MLEMREPVEEVVAEADQDDDVIGAKRHGVGERQKKRSAKDGDDAGRGGQVEFADRMADDWRASRNDHAFDRGVAETQFALHRQQVFVSQLDLKLPDLAFHELQCGLVAFDAVGGRADGFL